jgi:hypothetical protein
VVKIKRVKIIETEINLNSAKNNELEIFGEKK